MKNLILSVILLMAISLKAQKGKDFPSIIGLTLEGKAMHLPMKNGKRTVVAVVFSRSAEDDLKKWAAPLYEAFADRQTSELGMTAPEQVNFFFIPFIGGMKKMVEELKKGKVNFKNDDTSNIHQTVGKVSFGEQKIKENFTTFLEALKKAKPATAKGTYIQSLTICTTMGPAIKVSAN